jgi:DNA-binding IclR family transcriptional regulator
VDVRKHDEESRETLAGNLRGRGVLEGAFSVLEVLSGADGGAGLSDLARTAGLPKATAYRLVEQLVELGAVQRHGQRYFVGGLLARLGNSWQPDPGLARASREPVRLLAALTTSVTGVAVLRDERVRVVSATRGAVSDIPAIRAYDEFPRETAAGRVLLLAGQSERDEPPPDVSRAEWRRYHTDLRRSGTVAMTHEDKFAGVSCVAAPVRRPDGKIVGSVSALLLKPAVPAGLPELVLRAAREINRNLARG